MVRINIGCGATSAPGWVNLDNSWTIRLAKWPAAVRLLSRVGPLSETLYVEARRPV